MPKYFNTEGRCRPDIHYMVKLDDRLARMRELYVDRGKYFVINRARQYGKTTTMMALAEDLRDTYAVMFMDFQLMSSANFADEPSFVIALIEYMEDLLSEREELLENMDKEVVQNLISLKESERISMDKLFRGWSRVCRTAKRPVVLMIDEVDSASNHQVFLDFLAMLRGYYLNRDSRPTFHAVILAGVYDIKNLKLKLRPEEEHQYNSPWNIAAEFDMDMSFSAEQIADMLGEYQADWHVEMDGRAVAQEIYQYTSGYPYLVSLICKILDEKLSGADGFLDTGKVWSREGVAGAVKILLKSNVPLFDSLIKQLDAFKDLRDLMQGILYQGKQVAFSPAEKSIQLGKMFGFLKEENNDVAITNRIFEMFLLNFFIAEESVKSEIYFDGQRDRNQFLTDHGLNMELVLEKFITHFADIYGDDDERFVEEHGRKFFLLYLKPIINGVGNYYIEAQTRDARRTDVIVDYLGEQYIVELKIWHGNEYNESGRKQLADYLDAYHQKKGYLLSFNFNKHKERGIKKSIIDGKTIIEAVV